MSDPQVADAALVLPFTQCSQVRINIDQVMHLHQVDSFRAQKRHRAFHRFDSALFTTSPDFGGQKEFAANSEGGTEIADHLFGMTVHGR